MTLLIKHCLQNLVRLVRVQREEVEAGLFSERLVGGQQLSRGVLGGFLQQLVEDHSCEHREQHLQVRRVHEDVFLFPRVQQAFAQVAAGRVARLRGTGYDWQEAQVERRLRIWGGAGWPVACIRARSCSRARAVLAPVGCFDQILAAADERPELLSDVEVLRLHVVVVDRDDDCTRGLDRCDELAEDLAEDHAGRRTARVAPREPLDELLELRLLQTEVALLADELDPEVEGLEVAACSAQDADRSDELVSGSRCVRPGFEERHEAVEVQVVRQVGLQVWLALDEVDVVDEVLEQQLALFVVEAFV